MNSYEDIKNMLAIFGVPRSGTSWVGQIFNSSPRVAYRFQPLFSYEFKDRINENSSSADIEKFNQDLLNARSDFVLQKTNISGKEGPGFIKSYVDTLVWKEVRYLNVIENIIANSEYKLILVARHPCGVINSWLQAPKEFNKSWDITKEWRFAEKKNLNKPEEYNGYEKWKEAAKIFIKAKKEFPEKVMIVKYEDLVAEPYKKTKAMFDFASLPLEEQTTAFLQDSTSTTDKDPYGVFRKFPDTQKWKNELDKDIADKILADFNNSQLKSELGY